MASAFDGVVTRATDRLRSDPELRLEVANELMGHLRDAAGEHRRSGLSEAQAAAAAVRDLGDESDLADELWRAHRQRMRVRGGVRLTAQATLIPAALLVALLPLLLTLPDLAALRSLRTGGPGGSETAGGAAARERGEALLDSLRRRWASRLANDERFVLSGDPAAATPLERERSVAQRWPQNALYHGNYAAAYLDAELGPLPDVEALEPAALAAAVTVLERGEELEPDNAFFTLMKAWLMVSASSRLHRDADRAYDTYDADGSVRRQAAWAVEVTDAAQFGRGLDELRRAAGKAMYASPARQMIELRLNLLPPARRLADHLARVGAEALAPASDLARLREVSHAALAFAVAEADAGRAGPALDLVGAVETLASKLGAGATRSVELLVAVGLQAAALGHAQIALESLGMRERAAAAREELRAELRYFHGVFAQPSADGDLARRSGVLMRGLLRALPGYRPEPAPLREAEHAVAEQAMLTAMLLGLDAAAVAAGIVALVVALFARRSGRASEGPILVWIGWRRAATVMLLAAALPLAVYALYAASPLGGRQFGLHAIVGRLLLEHLVLAATVGLMLATLTARAIRQRCSELGIPCSAPTATPVRRSALSPWALAGGAAACLVAWACSSMVVGGQAIAALLSVAVLIALVVYAVSRVVQMLSLARSCHVFAGTLVRTAAPMLAAVALSVGVVGHASLLAWESAAVRRIQGPAALPFPQEVERTDLRLLRDRFARSRPDGGQAPPAPVNTGRPTPPAASS